MEVWVQGSGLGLSLEVSVRLRVSELAKSEYSQRPIGIQGLGLRFTRAPTQLQEGRAP